MSSRTKLLSTLLGFIILSCVANCCHCHGSTRTAIKSPEGTGEPTITPDQKFFLQNIFGKYGNNSLMTFEGFEHLLESLGILDIDHGLKDHKDGKFFLKTHVNHEHSKSSGSRNKGEVFQVTTSSSHDHPHHNHNDHHEHHEHDEHHEHHEHHPHDSKTEFPEKTNISSIEDIYSELNNPENQGHRQCLSPKEMYMTFNMDPGTSLNPMMFLIICPAIIYDLDQCQQLSKEEDMHKEVGVNQWVYAFIAVVLISLCGLFSVAVIPIMQKWFYHTLLQFLVGLAIGSLSGDALLHLLPHAMQEHSSDDHHHGESDPAKEAAAIWTGFCSLAGIYIFFIMERGLSSITTFRRQKRMKRLQAETSVAFNNEDGETNGNVGEKLSQYRKNSYNSQISRDGKESIQMLPDPESRGSISSKRGSRRSSSHEVGFHGRSSFSTDPLPEAIYQQTDVDPEKLMVTVSEHHGHGHGHSHEVPDSVSAVAWMVIMGDGLHNFCDGIAIGAAFATSVGDGISTTVAVFCHELPHELGDFAMLLKTGMKVKQALLYNLLSSVLCLFGMVIGVSLGGVESATMWIFAGTAGMFLYIALVDMLPELTTTSDDPGSTMSFTLAVQVLGITLGVCIMLMIALFEDSLKSIVS